MCHTRNSRRPSVGAGHRYLRNQPAVIIDLSACISSELETHPYQSMLSGRLQMGE